MSLWKLILQPPKAIDANYLVIIEAARSIGLHNRCVDEQILGGPSSKECKLEGASKGDPIFSETLKYGQTSTLNPEP